MGGRGEKRVRRRTGRGGAPGGYDARIMKEKKKEKRKKKRRRRKTGTERREWCVRAWGPDLRCGLQWDCAWSRARGQGRTVGLGHRTRGRRFWQGGVCMCGVCRFLVAAGPAHLEARSAAGPFPSSARDSEPTVRGAEADCSRTQPYFHGGSEVRGIAIPSRGFKNVEALGRMRRY